jgi:hypothetical protein
MEQERSERERDGASEKWRGWSEMEREMGLGARDGAGSEKDEAR